MMNFDLSDPHCYWLNCYPTDATLDCFYCYSADIGPFVKWQASWSPCGILVMLNKI